MTPITFLEPRMLKEWLQLHMTLREIILYIADEWWPEGPMVFTRIWSSEEENKAMGGYKHSPHPAYRAVDLRNRTLNDAQQATLVSRVNYRWIYDPSRPSKKIILNNDRWSTGPHFHVQVHPNTRLRCEAR